MIYDVIPSYSKMSLIDLDTVAAMVATMIVMMMMALIFYILKIIIKLVEVLANYCIETRGEYLSYTNVHTSAFEETL
jgi:hypothetical protein